MQYTYSYTLLIHIPILKPIGDENSEHCLWFLQCSKSSMLCNLIFSLFELIVSSEFFSFPQEADESLNFEEQILEAARAITGAASALVKAAASAQRELVASGRVRHSGTIGDLSFFY